MSITLRDAAEEDEPFLREVYASTRVQELALVPWNNEQREAFLRMQFDAQHFHYHSHFPEASYQIILQDAQPIGRLYALRKEGEIRIMDITLLPQHRNAGIGASLVRELLEEADRTGKAVNIWVEEFNPSRSLFERLGFSKVEEDGFNYLLEYRINR
ncbi:MAG TPA: GNAT family N-acetyltransferase [Pyrinomonadaceae bacterium]|jgi:GNAT superfamily N-acetyltransferase